MRRGRKTFIAFLLLSAMFVFVYIRKELFFQKVKTLIEESLAKSLHCELSIGKIKPAILSGVVVEKLKISFSGDSGFNFDITVDQARIDYSLKELLFSEPEDVPILRLISPTLRLSGQPREKMQSGLKSAPQDTIPKFISRDFVFILEKGTVLFDKEAPLLTDLEGRLFLNSDGLYFQDIKAVLKDNPQDALNMYGELTSEKLLVTLNLNHLKAKNFDILTNATLSITKKLGVDKAKEKISGTLKTYGTVLNNRPFSELNSSFEIIDKQLRILTCAIGEEYDLRGIVELEKPFSADLSLNFFQAAPHELMAKLTYPERPDFSGLVNGLIKMTGPLDTLKLEGYLESKNGNFGELDFISADINLEGQYPKIFIVDSRVSREDESFIMDGEIDFSNINSFELNFSADKGIFWKGWDITRDDHYNTVHMSKNIAEDVKVTFDTFIDEHSMGLEDVYTNELGLEYKIFGDKTIKLRLRKDEGILGVERRFKF
ncbi:MAG: hypothetical protein JW869_04180 [Candidatus Omnitrophica bacterium]|nr:hypothetical protein [Candidatus Omnitrophota bacterium]